MPLRILVVDDEPLARLGIIARLKSESDVVVVGECETGEQAVDAIRNLEPNLMFLDIQMTELSGLNLLRSMTPASRPAVVLLTAFREYALEAFELQVLDYLLKPIDDDRFHNCVERAREYLELHSHGHVLDRVERLLNERGEQAVAKYVNHFALREQQKVMFLKVKDIDWIESLGDYVGLHASGKTHLLRQSIKTLQHQLDPTCFCRIHRSTIIRIDRLVKIASLPNRDSIVTLRDGTSLRVSRTFSDGIRDIFRTKR